MISHLVFRLLIYLFYFQFFVSHVCCSFTLINLPFSFFFSFCFFFFFLVFVSNLHQVLLTDICFFAFTENDLNLFLLAENKIKQLWRNVNHWLTLFLYLLTTAIASSPGDILTSWIVHHFNYQRKKSALVNSIVTWCKI